jgi:membrane protein DedA with SNARE-associated domain/rhodanese-related sulfurtransferase
MDSWISVLLQHGYLALFAAVFLEAVGIPIPAALALLLAGGASATGSLQPGPALIGAVSTMIVADTLMFLMGRSMGWWLLGLLCRLSFNPESCILRSADSFYRRGHMLLVFAKFVPGINTMSPPLAGSMNMRLAQFLRFDVAGAVLYVGTYFSVGYVFSGAIGAITKGYQAFGRVLSWTLILLVAGYLGSRVWLWRKGRALRSVPSVGASEAASAMLAGDAVIYDVRSHGYYDPKATRIQGSRRLEPNALHQADEEFPNGKQVYLYCTCARDATSARVAQELRAKGVHTAVIKGGLRSWRKAGLPVEIVPAGDMAAMPTFDR